MTVKSIILATEQRENMKSNKATVLHSILGKPLISYTIDTLREMDIEGICILTGDKAKDIKSVLGNSINYGFQDDISLKEIKSFIEKSEDIIVLDGNNPLVTSQSLMEMLVIHRQSNNGATVLSATLEKPENYSRAYIFKAKALQSALLQIKNKNGQGFYPQDILGIFDKEEWVINTMDIGNVSDLMKVNSRSQLAHCGRIMKERINKKHMDRGVIIEDPNNTYIGPEVNIGYDTTIEPNCMLKGTTVIGNDCFIGNGTNIENSQISNGVHIENSHIYDSFIDDHTDVGPFAYIRPQSTIGKNVKIGDFVEIKNSSIGDYTKVSHLTYVGDADVGKHVNFGCGSVLVNYDGINKHRSTIEDYAFIGCNTNLVSPVTIGERAYTAAGSTITNNVPQESLGISRAKQVNKEGWVAYKYPKK